MADSFEGVHTTKRSVCLTLIVMGCLTLRRDGESSKKSITCGCGGIAAIFRVTLPVFWDGFLPFANLVVAMMFSGVVPGGVPGQVLAICTRWASMPPQAQECFGTRPSSLTRRFKARLETSRRFAISSRSPWHAWKQRMSSSTPRSPARRMLGLRSMRS